jgi:hypothetical protein
MKIQKTFTIDKEIYIKFNEYCKERSINKSLFVENSIKNIIYQYDNNKKNENNN